MFSRQFTIFIGRIKTLQLKMREDAKTKKETGRVSEQLNSPAGTLGSYAAAAAVTAVFLVLLFLRFDAYYDLNDDVLMEDLLSGAYTGAPAFRNIQSYYPLTLLLGGLYRISQNIPWYGAFLMVMQSVSLMIILGTIFKSFSGRSLITAVFSAFLICGFISQHFVFVQYSVTVGLLCTAAAALLTDRQMPFGRRAGIASLLLLTAYLLRSEMMIMMLPFVGIAALEQCMKAPGNCAGDGKLKGPVRLLVLTGLLGLIFAAGYGGNMLGYRAPEWKQFYAFFDARTQLYDFAYIPDYAGNEAFYDDLGMSPEEVLLLQNYNFGLNEELTADDLAAVAAYAAQSTLSGKDRNQQFREAAWNLRETILRPDEENRAGAYAVLLLYPAAFLLLVLGFLKGQGRRDLLLSFVLLFGYRTALWMYLLYVHRAPVRLTHPMYLAEIVFLILMLGRLLPAPSEEEGGIRPLPLFCAAILLTALIAGGRQIDRIRTEYDRREEVNVPYRSYLTYCAEHPDERFFIDVYSTVAFSRKMFDNSSRQAQLAVGQDLLGGWACKSPLFREKLSHNGLPGVREGLLLQQVYFVTRKDDDTDWLVRYYETQGIPVTLRQEGLIGNYFAVYEVREEP